MSHYFTLQSHRSFDHVYVLTFSGRCFDVLHGDNHSCWSACEALNPAPIDKLAVERELCSFWRSFLFTTADDSYHGLIIALFDVFVVRAPF